MKKSTLTLVAASVILACSNVFAAGDPLGLDNLQEKINRIAAQKGIKAPDLRKELATIVEGGELPDGMKAPARAMAGKAVEEPDEASLQEAIKKRPSIKKIVNIEANQVRAIEKSDGTIMYMIDNGRFALTGKMVDVWNFKPLNTIDDIDYAVHHINLDNMGFDAADFNSVSVGKGKKHVTIFVDPRCTWCHRLMDEIEAKPALKDEYTFDFIIIASLGPESQRLTQLLYCAKDKDPKKKWEALKSGFKAIESLEQEEVCDSTVLRETDIKRYLMGIRGVPFVINHDGTFTKGMPRDLTAFLEGKDRRVQGLQTAPDVIRNAPKLPAPNAAAQPAPEVKRVDLSTYDVPGMNLVTVGTGPKTVTVFVDPQCGWCHRLMDEVNADAAIQKDYTFRFVVVGILGPESQRLAKAMSCAKTTDQKTKWDALRAGKKGIDKLEAAKDCDDVRYNKSQSARTSLGINGVPFIVAPDGHTAAGKPANLRNFLENKAQPAQEEAKPAPKPTSVDLKAQGFDPKKLNVLSMGSGKEHVTVFVDPRCTWCHKLMDQINSNPEFFKKYTFDFVVLGLLGDTSEELAQKLYCANAKPAEKWKALMAGKDGIEKLKLKKGCEVGKGAPEKTSDEADDMMEKLGIEGVPYVVAPDKRILGGFSPDLMGWLTLGKKK